MKVNHLAIAVKDINESRELWSKLLRIQNAPVHTLQERGVIACTLETENLVIELVQPIDENSPIWKFVNEKGGGLHHIAFDTSDIEADIERGKSHGFRFLQDEPVEGLDNTRVVFLHPKSLGVLVELVEPQQ